MSHHPQPPNYDDLPPDADIPKERWPGQFERYREDPSFGDYEAMLGDSELNIDNLEDFLRVTEHRTPPPWEREGPCGKDAGLHQSGKWKGRDPAEVAAECCAAEAAARAKDAARGPGSPGPCGPDGASDGPATRAGATKKKRCAGDSSSLPRFGGGPGRGSGTSEPPPKPSPETGEGLNDARRIRKPRCTKRAKVDRLENVARWLHSGLTTAQIYFACKELFGLGERSAQIYLKEVKQQLADEAAAEDHLAHLQLSKNQHNDLYAIARRNLDKIEDATKIASLLRAANTVLKDRDKVMEDIRHHRAVTRRDQSPDSRKNRLKRDDIVEMPFAELCERIENLRNLNWWDWNQARMFGGETHFNDILSRKIDPELGYYDAIRAKNWQWYAKKRAEREAAEAAEAAEREKGGAGERVTGGADV